MFEMPSIKREGQTMLNMCMEQCEGVYLMNEIERLREVNITQVKWLYDEQQAHKTLRNKVRQWLGDDKFDILKENE